MIRGVLNKLLKSENDAQINYFLQHNPNKVCYVKTKPLPAKIYGIYNNLKSAAQTKLKESQDMKTQIDSTIYAMLEKIYDKVEAGNMGYEDVPSYLRKEFDFNESEIKNFLYRFRTYSEMRKIQKRIENS